MSVIAWLYQLGGAGPPTADASQQASGRSHPAAHRSVALHRQTTPARQRPADGGARIVSPAEARP